MKSAGIYLHIPFCAVKCMYCDFYSITDRENSIPTFIKAIVQEIKECRIDASNWIIDTIHFNTFFKFIFPRYKK